MPTAVLVVGIFLLAVEFCIQILYNRTVKTKRNPPGLIARESAVLVQY